MKRRHESCQPDSRETAIELGDLLCRMRPLAAEIGYEVVLRPLPPDQVITPEPVRMELGIPSVGIVVEAIHIDSEWPLHRAALWVIRNAGGRGASKEEIDATLRNAGRKHSRKTLGTELWRLNKDGKIRLVQRGSDYRWYLADDGAVESVEESNPQSGPPKRKTVRRRKAKPEEPPL